MSIDLVPWIVRAVLIIVGIIVAIMVGKRKKKFYWGIFVIGITAFIMGVILLAVSFMTGQLFDISLFLTAAGVIVILIGLVAQNRVKQNR